MSKSNEEYLGALEIEKYIETRSILQVISVMQV